MGHVIVNSVDLLLHWVNKIVIYISVLSMIQRSKWVSKSSPAHQRADPCAPLEVSCYRAALVANQNLRGTSAQAALVLRAHIITVVLDDTGGSRDTRCLVCVLHSHNPVYYCLARSRKFSFTIFFSPASVRDIKLLTSKYTFAETLVWLQRRM